MYVCIMYVCIHIEGLCKEVEVARLHNKTHLVRQITSRYAPQIPVIKDGPGHLLTEPGEIKQR